MLYRLATGLSRDVDAQVVSLTSLGPLGPRLRAEGIKVTALGMTSAIGTPSALVRLGRVIRKSSPDVVQTWMYHADLLGGLAAKLAGVPVCWCLQNSTLAPDRSRWTTRAVMRACARLSRSVPKTIVSCAAIATQVHAAHGYDESRMRVIPNGIDVELFKPDQEARRGVRAELGLNPDTVIVGVLARNHPQKDYATLLRAMTQVWVHRPDVHLLAAGDGVEATAPEYQDALRVSGVAARVHLLGRRDDTPRLHAALDVFVLASASGEAFPLAVGETMASGIPPVVTDVGDARHLVGDAGHVVPPADPKALAEALLTTLSLDPSARAELGRRARERVSERFSLAATKEAYMDTWRNALGAP